MSHFLLYIVTLLSSHTSQTNASFVRTALNRFLNWTSANQFCQDAGTDLASIHSEADFNETKTLCILSGANYCWIGLNDRESDGSWEWSDGSVTDYGFINDTTGTPTMTFPWVDGDPIGGGNEDCVCMSKSNGYRWIDDDCIPYEYPTICNEPPTDTFGIRKNDTNNLVNYMNQGRITGVSSWGIWMNSSTDQFGAIGKFSWTVNYESNTLPSGTDTIGNGKSYWDDCDTFTLNEDDYINEYRVFYGKYIYGLHFITKNGLIYICSIDEDTGEFDDVTYIGSDNIQYENQSLSGFIFDAGLAMNGIQLQFTPIDTSSPTTANPTTSIPTTTNPTTWSPTTSNPTTFNPTTSTPTTSTPTTFNPTTAVPSTFSPSTFIPTTTAPTSPSGPKIIAPPNIPPTPSPSSGGESGIHHDQTMTTTNLDLSKAEEATGTDNTMTIVIIICGTLLLLGVMIMIVCITIHKRKSNVIINTVPGTRNTTNTTNRNNTTSELVSTRSVSSMTNDDIVTTGITTGGAVEIPRPYNDKTSNYDFNHGGEGEDNNDNEGTEISHTFPTPVKPRSFEVASNALGIDNEIKEMDEMDLNDDFEVEIRNSESDIMTPNGDGVLEMVKLSEEDDMIITGDTTIMDENIDTRR